MDGGHSILIVEDEEAIRLGLIDLFNFYNYKVQAVSDGQEGLEVALNNDFDCILLDVMLPSVDGFAICNEIRNHSREQAIIMLTAKNSEEDIINGLSLGADDYITKPFSIKELVLRVESLIRRANLGKPGPQLTIGSHITIDVDNLCASIGEREILFTRREIDLLTLLKHNHHRPVSRQELLRDVWGYKKASEIDTRTVDIHVAKLRKKIETDSKAPALIKTIRGEGYRLVER